jgi:hypothetical protein
VARLEKGRESPSLGSQHGKDHWLLSEGTLHCQPAFSASLGRKGSWLEGKRKKKEGFRGAKGRKRKVSLRLQRKGIWP